MGRRKSNRSLSFFFDPVKPYVYVREFGKQIGIFGWDSRRGKWLYKDVIRYKDQ